MFRALTSSYSHPHTGTIKKTKAELPLQESRHSASIAYYYRIQSRTNPLARGHDITSLRKPESVGAGRQAEPDTCSLSSLCLFAFSTRVQPPVPRIWSAGLAWGLPLWSCVGRPVCGGKSISARRLGADNAEALWLAITCTILQISVGGQAWRLL